jgi:hypothetical protein
MATYEIGTRVVYKGEEGEIVNIVKPKCRCKGEYLYHILTDSNRKLTVSHKQENDIEVLTPPFP